MPLSGGTSGAHDDAMHQGNAKRDVVNGVAALDAGGHVLAPGYRFTAARGAAEQITIRERTSDERVFRWIRIGASDYEARVNVGGVEKVVQHAGLKDVANGIASISAGGSIQAPGGSVVLTKDVGDRIRIYERTSLEVAQYWERIGVDDFETGILVGGVSKVLQHEGMKGAANGIAGLDANAVIPHERIRVGSFRAEHRRKVVSNDLRHSHDSEDPILSGAWAKYKTITMTNGISGTLRIKHTSYCENGAAGATYSRIYKNGAALGAIQSNNTNLSYVEFSEDINVGDLQPGDTLEVWAYDGAYPDSRSVKNFRLYYVNEGSTVVASSNS